ncbi:MAG TPA: pyridoxal-phosphate dependent enzyme [Actinobacteria bacterium]|nr:pyridoxal-phosphate dependent enzyme [Actinomycetota bacterium]
MEIHDDVVAAIGNTPLVRLRRLHPPGNLVAKLEYLNPGGSSKDRIALAMIERAERLGLLRPGGTIVEPTSGNTGVGLAMVAALKGYRLVAVMADKQSKEKQDLLRAYGAEVVVCPTDVAPEDPRSYYSVADRLTREIPGAYRPDQYSNPANPQAQYETTGPEIWRQTDGEIGIFVAGIGTGGTITGVGRYLKERNPEVMVVGVDPEGSIYTAESDEDVHTYLTEGVGEDFWPETFDPEIVDRYEQVTDAEAFAMTRRLVREEGLLVGGSGGMAIEGALRVAREFPDELVVVVVPDSGRNYLGKIFDDDWMREQGLLDEEA